MTEAIDDRPEWRLVFDKDGDVDQDTIATLLDGIRSTEVTDLVLFSHGWNNDEQAAKSLYGRWFSLLAVQLDPARKVGFVGIRWPAQLWRDEPIPDFDPSPTPSGGGAAALEEKLTIDPGPPTIDESELDDLKEMFPTGATQLDTIAQLLTEPPTAAAATAIFDELKAFSAATVAGNNDGETQPSNQPGMLIDRDPIDVFTAFSDRMADSGVEFGDGGGTAGLSELTAKIWHGAKEALRQTTYWQMKNRAGVVGTNGLGPAIAWLAADQPELRVHLIGHSFGARLVSFALAGLPESDASPVKSVTLLQGAYSRFAFTDDLPFRDGAGALAGRLNRIDGPLTVCYSSHDRALGTLYPIASRLAGSDAAGAEDPLFQWRAMGSHGAYDIEPHTIGPVGTSYPFQPKQIINIDASEIVTQGDSPSGAHSDIFYPQLAWVAASAGGLTNP